LSPTGLKRIFAEMKRLSALFVSLCLAGMVLTVLQGVTFGSRLAKDSVCEVMKKAAEQSDDDCNDETGDDDPQTCTDHIANTHSLNAILTSIFSRYESNYAFEPHEKFVPPPRA
jgi:hypothetical protein